MNEYLVCNWQRIKCVLLELEELGLEQRMARVLSIEDTRLRREIHRYQCGMGSEMLERPLAQWVSQHHPTD